MPLWERSQGGFLVSTEKISSQDQGRVSSGTAYADESGSSSKDMTKVAIPVTVSLLAALAGIFYKIKSRGGSLVKQARKRK